MHDLLGNAVSIDPQSQVLVAAAQLHRRAGGSGFSGGPKPSSHSLGLSSDEAAAAFAGQVG